MAEARLRTETFKQTTLDWRVTITLIVCSLAILLATFSATAGSAIHQWNTSSAYNYGYLIAPISIYLLWIERHVIAVWRPAPSPLGLVVVGGFALLWLTSDLLGVDEGRHISLVGMMQGLFLTALGWPLYKRLLFPLSYLWLMVPTGEFLLEPLQKMAHAVAVFMLRLSDIPTYAEGILIQVPSGNFVVEPGCSGLNFLLASIALSLLYGKLTYRRLSARLVCIGVAISASIIANFWRVYLIVAITEWSDRKINIADDHLFYGWVFFGVIMMAMMWWGMRFRDVFEEQPDPANERPTQSASFSTARQAAYVGLAIVVFVIPALVTQVTAGAHNANYSISLPESVGSWKRTVENASWQPTISNSDSFAVARYSDGSQIIETAVAYYAAQFDGHEAASGLNSPASEPNWEVGSRGSRSIVISGKPIVAATAELRSVNDPRVVVSWYESSSCLTASRLVAKICAARERLAGRTSSGAYFAISTTLRKTQEEAFSAIEDFTRSLPPIKSAASASIATSR